MISQHKLKFEIGLLDDTFQWSTFVNGFVAILSGLIANVSVDYHGLIAPFMIAAGCCLLAFSLITLTWAGDTTERSVETTGVEPDQSVETTGKRVTRSMSKGSPVKSPVTSTLKKPTTKQAKESKVSLILSQWTFQLTLLGLLQTMFESSMYIFVFLWSPVLEKTSKTVPPFGLIFSTFMVCIMLGSFIFKYFVTRGYELKFILTIVFITATVSFIIPIFTLVLLNNVES
jgi:hypothetical protein